MVHSILAVSASLCPPVSPICGIAAATIVSSDIIVTHNSTHPSGYFGEETPKYRVVLASSRCPAMLTPHSYSVFYENKSATGAGVYLTLAEVTG